jgi:pyruvate dehydrogenase E2 component (dihydrolipoamide acetyltransferase)
MAEVIRMPRLSDTMEEGNIVAWSKKVGDTVKIGETLAEVETDKATMELESYHNGTLLYIGVTQGSVPVNGVLAIIGKPGEDFQSLISDTSISKVESSNSTSTIATESKIEEKVFTTAVLNSNSDSRVKASPLAKNLATTAGIPLANVTGSGDNGRIIRKDVLAVIENANGTHETKPIASSSVKISANMESYEEVPVSQMRKTIARRLSESLFTAPHFYLTMEINMDNAIESRKRLNESGDIKISFNDLIVKACAQSLKKHSGINSSWLGDKIRYNHHINIGVAVAVAEGLLVPVLRNADQKSLSEINQEVKLLAAKAKDKKLTPDEMTGNTFTISNLGMFDITEFTAIINPPDACILAIGSIIQKPIIKNGTIEVGNTMKVTLSCDHRVVDGATGAQFLQTLKYFLEDPIRMIV